MEEATKTKEKIKKFFGRKYTWTIIYAFIITLCLISINIIYKFINPSLIIENTDIMSISTLLISIIVIEKSYRDNGKNALSAIEFFLLSVYILLMNHISRIYNYDIQKYLDTGTILGVSYYLLKIVIIYTKEHKEQLNRLSDIRQIVKDEPIKKETKRKNIKK